MPDLARIMAPLGAESAPEDSLADVIALLRGQHPLPLTVVHRGAIIGSVGLEVLIPASGSDLRSVRVRDVMRPIPALDAGESVELAARRMMNAGGGAVLVTEPAGGLFSRDSRPVGL